MKILRAILLVSMFAQLAFSQTVTPTPVAAYINTGSGWNPWTSGAGFGALGATPLSVGLFCQVSASSQWTPCAIGATGAASITSGTIDNTVIGGTTPAAGTFFPFQANGSSGSPTSTLTYLTSTNSGSTLGIPLGYGCAIDTTFVSGSNYSSFAICMSNATSGTNGNLYIYNFYNSPLGSSYTNRAEIDHNGAFYGLLFQGGSFNSTASQTTVSCSTSGTAVFSQPFQGSSEKRVLIHVSSCLGTASYTYPLAFTNSPSVYASNNAAASIATSVSTTAVTVTGAATTGSLVLEDY